MDFQTLFIHKMHSASRLIFYVIDQHRNSMQLKLFLATLFCNRWLCSIVCDLDRVTEICFNWDIFQEG